MYTGELVRLREYRREDIAKAQAFVNDPEVSRLINTGMPVPYTLWDEEKFILSQGAGNKESYTFAIETLDDGVYIGGCGINRLDWKNRAAVVGIMIGDSRYWGRGYGTDAMRVLLGFLFDQLGLHRVSLNVFGYNERAIKSYRKCGFIEEGRMRECLYRDGRFHDEIVMSILRREYDSIYGRKD